MFSTTTPRILTWALPCGVVGIEMSLVKNDVLFTLKGHILTWQKFDPMMFVAGGKPFISPVHGKGNGALKTDANTMDWRAGGKKKKKSRKKHNIGMSLKVRVV